MPVTPATPETAPVAPAEAKPSGEAPAAPTAESSPGLIEVVGQAAAEAAGEEVEPAAPELAGAPASSALAEDVAKASREAAAAAAAAAELERRRAEAREEAEHHRRRRDTYLRVARYHLRYVELRVKEQDLDGTTLQLALLGQCLAGVRANLGRGPVTDELVFALGTLHDLDGIARNQDEVVAAAQAHLRAALDALPPVEGPAGATSLQPDQGTPPEPAAGELHNADEQPAEDDTALARRVAEVSELLGQKQSRTGRDRLQALVLELTDDPATELVELADEARRKVLEAAIRRRWRRAAGGVARIARALDELTAAVAPATAAPAPAAEGLQDAPHPAPSAAGGVTEPSGGTAAPAAGTTDRTGATPAPATEQEEPGHERSAHPR